MICAVGLLSAQQVSQGSLGVLRGVGRANLEVDYSEAVIQGMTEADYAAYETEWLKDKPSIIMKFVDEFNKVQDNLAIGLLPDVKYTCVLKVLNVTREGDIRAEFYVTETSTGDHLAEVTGIKAKGGRFGTGLNLMGDGMKNLGKGLGRFVNKNIK